MKIHITLTDLSAYSREISSLGAMSHVVEHAQGTAEPASLILETPHIGTILCQAETFLLGHLRSAAGHAELRMPETVEALEAQQYAEGQVKSAKLAQRQAEDSEKRSDGRRYASDELLETETERRLASEQAHGEQEELKQEALEIINELEQLLALKGIIYPRGFKKRIKTLREDCIELDERLGEDDLTGT